jgi:hypothetical protein
MDITNRYSLMIDSLAELAAEEAQVKQAASASGIPSLSTVIAEAAPLPREALFLGLAEDGLPVLLNLYDPIPGPILVTGDKASGKTSLLQMIARAVEMLHPPSEVQYGVITQYPDEWIRLRSNQNNVGVYTTQDNAAQELLQSLFTWAHNNKGEGQTILLLIDDLEVMTKLDQQAEQNLRWLLLRGPSRRVWPVITINAGQIQNKVEWLGLFRTRLFGCIRDPHNSHFVTGHSNNPLKDLAAGSQFTMLEGNNWLNFWAPSID